MMTWRQRRCLLTKTDSDLTGEIAVVERERVTPSDTCRAEGENPDLPGQGQVNMTKSDDDDQYDDDQDEQSKFLSINKSSNITWPTLQSLHFTGFQFLFIKLLPSDW